MKSRFKFTIARKLILGFGILGLVVFFTYRFIYTRLEENLNRNNNIAQIYAPSVYYVNDLKNMVTNSKLLIINWVFIEEFPDTKDKLKLKSIHEHEYDTLKRKLVYFVDNNLWDNQSKEMYFNIVDSVSQLFAMQEEIMEDLSTEQDYMVNTNFINQTIRVSNGDVSQITNKVLASIDKLLAIHQQKVSENTERMNQSFAEFRTMLWWVVVILMASMLILAFTLSNSLIKPISKLKSYLKQMSGGSLPEVKIEHRSDEIGEMIDTLKQLIASLRQTSQFALKIGEGNFEAEFQQLSKHDVLGNSLILMRENLIKAEKDAELRRVENFQRNWASQGVAEFGELLRSSSDSLENLANNIIAKLVRYLNANMGGLYIVNDEKKYDIHFELLAFYAYDRHKFINKRIDIGENMVGQCYQENETIFLTDLPPDYVHITSGLGSDNPRCLLIVPLKVNQETFGVVELASFTILEPYQIEFVEKIGETIASTISSVKINLQTNRLLAESHEKSERLAKQEEEVRKNIDKMQMLLDEKQNIITRETARIDRLQNDFEQALLGSQRDKEQAQAESRAYRNNFETIRMVINNSAGYYELTVEGRILFANQLFLKCTEQALVTLENTSILSLIELEKSRDSFMNTLEELNVGKAHTELMQYKINNKTRYFLETFTPVRDINGDVIKIAVMSFDLTDEKTTHYELENHIEDLKAELEILKSR